MLVKESGLTLETGLGPEIAQALLTILVQESGLTLETGLGPEIAQALLSMLVKESGLTLETGLGPEIAQALPAILVQESEVPEVTHHAHALLTILVQDSEVTELPENPLSVLSVLYLQGFQAELASRCLEAQVRSERPLCLAGESPPEREANGWTGGLIERHRDQQGCKALHALMVGPDNVLGPGIHINDISQGRSTPRQDTM